MKINKHNACGILLIMLNNPIKLSIYNTTDPYEFYILAYT